MTIIVLFVVAALVFALWHSAYGYCSKCRRHRAPRCGCSEINPHVRKVNWKHK